MSRVFRNQYDPKPKPQVGSWLTLSPHTKLKKWSTIAKKNSRKIEIHVTSASIITMDEIHRRKSEVIDYPNQKIQYLAPKLEEQKISNLTLRGNEGKEIKEDDQSVPLQIPCISGILAWKTAGNSHLWQKKRSLFLHLKEVILNVRLTCRREKTIYQSREEQSSFHLIKNLSICSRWSGPEEL